MNRKIFAAASILTLAALAPQAGWAAGNTATANFDVHAHLLKPITITKIDDLHFGRIIKNPLAAGTVTINPVDGAIVSSDPAGLMLMGGHQRARFFIICESMFAYTVTLPNTVTLTKLGLVGPPTPDQQLTADNFRGAFDGYLTSFPSGFIRNCDELPAGGFASDMQDILWVGATLNITATNETGKYLGTGAVTVTYQ